MRKYLCAFLIMAALAAVFLPIAGLADAWTDFSVSFGEMNEEIYPTIKGKKTYLFLPGVWDAQKLVYHSSGSYLVDGQPLLDGARTDVFIPGQTVVLTNEKGRKVREIIVMQGSRIPALFIQSESGSMKKINQKNANAEPGRMTLYDSDGTVSSHALAHVHRRGNSTSAFPKKAYQIKLDKKADLTRGGGKAKTWILLADYMDMSLLRNRVTLDMAAYTGLPYALDCISVDVYLCGEYGGVYLLTEKAQIGSARVNVRDLEEAMEEANEQPLDSYPAFAIWKDDSFQHIKGSSIENATDDITGGYLLEVEKPYRYHDYETTGFITGEGLAVVVKEPKFATEEQLRYVGDIFNAFHRAILSEDGVDAETGAYYLDRFDLDSLVTKYLLEEISKNYDAHSSSQFFYKDSDAVDSKIYAGPAWDYDLSYGGFDDNGSFQIGQSAKTFYLNKNTRRHLLYNHLIKYDDFSARLREIYQERFMPAMEILLGERTPKAGMRLKSIEMYQAEIADSAAMNGKLWNSTGAMGYVEKAGKDFPSAVAFLTRFISERYGFLSGEWGG